MNFFNETFHQYDALFENSNATITLRLLDRRNYNKNAKS